MEKSGYKVFKVAIIKSNKIGDRREEKLDDFMVCLTEKAANEFTASFNSHNTGSILPDFYMYADYQPKQTILNYQQMQYLTNQPFQRAWENSMKRFE